MSFSTHPRTFKEIVDISYNNIYLRNIRSLKFQGANAWELIHYGPHYLFKNGQQSYNRYRHTLGDNPLPFVIALKSIPTH